MNPNKHDNDWNNLESDNESAMEASGEKYPPKQDRKEQNKEADTPEEFASEDKYLALEQKGVSFTDDKDPMSTNPDNIEYRQHGQTSDIWDNNNRNSRNAEAFNQDEFILRDNIDLDEDQPQSISSDDDVDALNTSDGL